MTAFEPIVISDFWFFAWWCWYPDGSPSCRGNVLSTSFWNSNDVKPEIEESAFEANDRSIEDLSLLGWLRICEWLLFIIISVVVDDNGEEPVSVSP